MEVSVNLEDVEKSIISNNFRDFIITNTKDFRTAAFILQSLTDALQKAKEENKET